MLLHIYMEEMHSCVYIIKGENMKTNLTEQELNFYNALCKDMEEHRNKSSNDFYLNRLFKSVPIKDKSYDEIDFIFDLDSKRKFIDDSVLLFDAINCIYVGKIRGFFWMLNEYENLYFISKSIVDVTNRLMIENIALNLNDLSSFYEINQNFYKNGDFKDYLEEYRLFAKQYGYDFDLMKDIDDYEGIEEDIDEFNKLLASYGIVNEEE